jgi:neutral ceramidase
MTTRFALRSGALFLLLWTSWLGAEDQAPPAWKAGVAKVKITPAKPMWMSGYSSRDKPAEGTLTDLWAKALFVEDPKGKQAVLVTLDLVGIGRHLAQPICADLMKAHHLEREAITLCVSHTHTGPVVDDNLNTMYQLAEDQQQLVKDYARTLHQRVVEVVDAARKDLKPARLEWGTGSASFAVNRRNNKEADVPQLREKGELKGPVDHEVPVLAVRGTKGELRAVVFGYACHSTVLSFYQWSGDYPGFAQIALEKTYPDAVALFWAGCGGDQNPLPRRSVALAEKYGGMLADSVEAVLAKPRTPVKGSLRLSYEEIDLPFGELPSREQLLHDTMDKNKYLVLRARALLKQLEDRGSIRGTYPYPVQAWQLGSDLTWVMLGGEVVVDYSLRLKKELGPGKVWVMGYANDVMAYIPSLRVLKEGGYEGASSMIYYGQPTVWGPGIEEVIVKAAHARVKTVRGEK